MACRIPTCASTLAAAKSAPARERRHDSPTWDTTLYHAVPGAQLLIGPITVSYIDRGLIHDVNICTANVSIKEQYLHDGSFRLNCGNGSYAQIALKDVNAGVPPAVDGGATD
jgi:hypothetical protein